MYNIFSVELSLLMLWILYLWKHINKKYFKNPIKYMYKLSIFNNLYYIKFSSRIMGGDLWGLNPLRHFYNIIQFIIIHIIHNIIKYTFYIIFFRTTLPQMLIKLILKLHEFIFKYYASMFISYYSHLVSTVSL